MYKVRSKIIQRIPNEKAIRLKMAFLILKIMVSISKILNRMKENIYLNTFTCPSKLFRESEANSPTIICQV